MEIKNIMFRPSSAKTDDASECPFESAVFSELPPVIQEEQTPSYVKSECDDSLRQQIPDVSDEPLICRDFTIVDDTIVHIPTGEYIPNSGIDVLLLSARPYNALRRGGIKTIVQLADLTMAELQNVRNLGKNSYNEVVRLFNQFLYKQVSSENQDLTNQRSCGIAESIGERSDRNAHCGYF